jgi:Reverse transcriptase (RNA-dependent DNA polymerase)
MEASSKWPVSTGTGEIARQMGRTGPARLTRVTKITYHVRRSQRGNNLRLVCVAFLFDNINHNRLIHVFQSLGFPLELTSWLSSFLLDRSVKLRFNGFVSDPIKVGAPQGSPTSPVRSIIYTYPFLLKMHQWNNSSLSMYVDDGLIFACGASYDSVSHRLRSALQALHRVRRMAHAIGTWYRARKS